jgi:1,2-phenylacetyl-CoA epoxidase PaaB subunit
MRVYLPAYGSNLACPLAALPDDDRALKIGEKKYRRRPDWISAWVSQRCACRMGEAQLKETCSLGRVLAK